MCFDIAGNFLGFLDNGRGSIRHIRVCMYEKEEKCIYIFDIKMDISTKSVSTFLGLCKDYVN